MKAKKSEANKIYDNQKTDYFPFSYYISAYDIAWSIKFHELKTL